MAVVPWEVVAKDGRGFLLVKWPVTGTSFADSDTGQPFNVSQYNDKTVQVEGTLGTGVTIQGSLDPDASAYETLNDPQGNALSAITNAKIENILEHCFLVRPSLGTGVSGVTVWLLLASVR